jgi:hypothetical protein
MLKNLRHDFKLLKVKIIQWLFERDVLDELMQVLKEFRLKFRCTLNEIIDMILSQVAGRGKQY